MEEGGRGREGEEGIEREGEGWREWESEIDKQEKQYESTKT